MSLRVYFLPLLFLTTGLAAQSDSIGQWRALQSFANGTYVTQSEASIIYTTGQAVFYLDKEDLSITRLTKTDGLSETQIRIIRYHAPTETLIIIYQSGVIDLLRSGNRITTLRQISNFNFSGDKQIYSVYTDDSNTVYFAAGYGVSAVDLTPGNETFTFTTFTGVRVDGIARFQDNLYAATEEGLYRAPATGVNLNDFGNWSLLGAEIGLPEDYSSTAVTNWMGVLYFGVGTDVYSYDGAGTVRLRRDEDEGRDWRIQYISGGPTKLIVGYQCTESNCGDRRVSLFRPDGSYIRGVIDCFFRTNYAIEDERGRLWFGDGAEDIRYLTDIETNNCERLVYPGPPSDQNFRLFHDGSDLWVAPGPLNQNFSPEFNFSGVYRFSEGNWSSLNRNNTEVFRGRDGARDGNDDVATIIDVDFDPVSRLYWFSSFYEGVIGYDLEAETGTLYDETNSTLQESLEEAAGRVRVAGARTDANGFTYFANSRATGGDFVSVRSPEGDWAVLGTDGCNANLALDIRLDANGFVWVIHATNVGEGLTVIDPAGTPMDPSDDRCRQFTAANSALPTSIVQSIEVDLDGVVWVGTTEGIVLFECTIDPFNTERCLGRRPPVQADDGFGGFLLESEEIRSIKVDGGNRKWVGTTGGVFLLSPDGSEQLAFFDENNSPLLDDLVRSITINPTDGTVYFGTEFGINSFKAEASTAQEFFPEELTIFPNPVEPGYDGPVAVDGLQRDARVKITDVSGKLVFEGDAVGGRFLWDGADYNGRRVTSGVYLVFASTGNGANLLSTAGADSAVGKIVFIR